MCADTAVCALSESSFVEAINKGTYPYDDAGAQGKVSANLDNYAKYLLGVPPAGGETFQATVSQIDLQGAWLIEPGQKVGGQVTCIEEQGGLDVTTDLDDPENIIMFPSLAAAMGDFRPDSTGNGLTWEWVMARVPAEGASHVGSTLNFSAAALPGVDAVQLQSEFELKKITGQASARPKWPPLLLGAAAIVPGALALRQGRRRPHLTMISLVLIMFLLAGCFGLGVEFWGTVASDAQFTELEFLGGDAMPVVGSDGLPGETPLWHMRGLADYTVDTNFGAYDDEGNEAVIRCSGTATYHVEAQIFKDIVVAFE